METNYDGVPHNSSNADSTANEKTQSTRLAAFIRNLKRNRKANSTENKQVRRPSQNKPKPRVGAKPMAGLALLGAMLFSSSAFAQGQGGTQAGFEVDASYFSGFIPPFWNSTNYLPPGLTTGDDWSKGPSGNAVLLQQGGVSVPGITPDGRAIWQVDGNWGNANNEQSTFSGNSNKNGDPIGPGQKPYSIQFGGSGPQKNDITNTFLHSRVRQSDGHLWLFFAAETRATNGTSYLDFEYNQNGVIIDSASGQLRGPANNPGQNIINGRTVGDFILFVDYTNGGQRPVVGIRTWLASGVWSNPLPVTSAGAFIGTNTQQVNAVAPNKAFTPAGSPANVVAPLQLVEGGVDITALNLQLDQCNPEGTVTIKTRSSASFTAELKDLDLLKFSLTPAATADLFPVAAKCLGAGGNVVIPVKGTFSGGTPSISVIGAAQFSVPVTSNDTVSTNVTVNGAGTIKVVLTVTPFNAACPTAKDTIELVVTARPQADVDPEDSLCQGTGGNTVFHVTGTYANGTPTWSAVGGTLSNQSYVNGNASADVTVSGAGQNIATVKLTVVSANSDCPDAKDSISLSVVAAAVADIVPVGTLCEEEDGTTEFNISGTYANGTPVLTVAQGPGNITFFQAANGIFSAKVDVTGTGTNIVKLLLTVSTNDPDCPQAKDSIFLSVSDRPDGPSLHIVNPDCENEFGTITVKSPVGAGIQYQNFNGPWQSSPVFQFRGGEGYSIKVRFTADTGCVSDPVACPDTLPVPQQQVKQELSVEPGIKEGASMKIYPNPFSTVSTIEFKVPTGGQASLGVYDITGKMVMNLFNGTVSSDDVKQVKMDGTSLPNGIYFTRLTVDGQVMDTSKMVIQK